MGVRGAGGIEGQGIDWQPGAAEPEAAAPPAEAGKGGEPIRIPRTGGPVPDLGAAMLHASLESTPDAETLRSFDQIMAALAGGASSTAVGQQAREPIAGGRLDGERVQALVAALGRTAHAEARAQALQRHGELMQLYERERLGSQASARSAAFVQAGLELLGTAALPAQEQVALALAVADSAYVAARQSGVPLERQQLAQAQQSAEQLLARFQVARELGGIDRRLTEEDFRWSAGLIERGWLEREPPRELATALALGLRQRAAETCTRIASDAQQLLASGGLQTLSPAALQALQQEATQLLRKGVLEQPAQLQAVASVAGGAAARLASLARQGAAAR